MYLEILIRMIERLKTHLLIFRMGYKFMALKMIRRMEWMRLSIESHELHMCMRAFTRRNRETSDFNWVTGVLVFFHIEASIKSSNKNSSSTWIEVELIEEEDQIIDHAVNYYRGLYRSESIIENDLVTDVIHSSVSCQQNSHLVSVPGEEEIYKVVC